jgi:hypothetical protein
MTPARRRDLSAPEATEPRSRWTSHVCPDGKRRPVVGHDLEGNPICQYTRPEIAALCAGAVRPAPDVEPEPPPKRTPRGRR